MRIESLFRALLLGALVLTGCRPADPVPTGGRPAVLRLGYTPSEEGMVDREEAQQTLADYLAKALNLRVELVRTASYRPAIEAMQHGEIDIMALGPFAYVIAAQKQAAEAIVATARPGQPPRTYQSVFITHRRTGLATLADVPARSHDLRFCYTDPASNSGYLVPHAALQGLGLKAERDFDTTEFTLSHSVAIYHVLHNRADLAGVSASVLERLIAKGRLPGDELVILWQSDRLPAGPIAVRPSLPSELKAEIQRALVELPQRDPAAAREVMSQYPDSNLVYTTCDDAHYAGLRRLVGTEGLR
jgi:phosphonate transport system substrate-binding protein